MSMPDRDPRGDSQLRGFARKIARLERDLKILETAAQGAHRSVEEGAIDFYDEDGILRERVGKQTDGSYGRVTVEGPVPPTPSEPDVVVIDNGVVAITWDGRCDEKWPFAEFRNVRVHLGDTATFTPTRNNQVGTIHAHRGGTIVAVTESDDDNPVYVRLVAVSTAGHTSPPSDSVLVDEADEEDYEDEQEELRWEDGDGHTLTVEDIAAGTVTFGLSHDPEVESVVGYWGGVAQEPTEYTIDFDALTVTWPLDGFEKVGDRLWLHYAYMEGAAAQVLVDWQSPGWKYLQVTLSDSTDRSAPAFDDSAWTTSSAPFGNLTGHPQGWPDKATGFPNETGLWVRRAVTIPADVSWVDVDVRIDNYVDVYVDGTAIGTHTGFVGAVGPFTVAVTPGSTITVACRASDDATVSAGDYTYFDAKVTGRG